MQKRKVKITYRNKGGELNKICGVIEMPNSLTFTPDSNGEQSSPRRIASQDIAEINILEVDKALRWYKKQYKND